MERVHFQQEEMLAELKDLVQKGLFTLVEIKQIMKKRTMFETALVRRIAKKSDFLRYVTYEMGLERLRRKRVERLKLPPSPPSVSDYALVRRQFHIFERALRKFKSDVGLWIQYIQVAKKEGARALIGRIMARALQLHPNTTALYILAASHELESLSPAAARALLQRGIRLNPESIDIWKEYVKMELGFIESLRRRWGLLGINNKNEDTGVVEMEVDRNGANGRKEVMDGGIVKSVISSAAKALPKVELFLELQTVMIEYPSPLSLRILLLRHLYDVVRNTLPDDPQAIKLIATGELRLHPEGEGLIEALQRANEELISEASRNKGVLRVYTEFVEEWCGVDIDTNMKEYLLKSLHSVNGRGGYAEISR